MTRLNAMIFVRENISFFAKKIVFLKKNTAFFGKLLFYY